MKKICVQFNGNDAKCYNNNCKECYKKHIFCELYKIGLLGYVEPNPVLKNSFTQKFTHVGEHTFDEIRSLPESEYYLLHPILDELIRQKNTFYKSNINTINIVGYDRPWRNENLTNAYLLSS